jgi:hypothetical protein
MKKINYSAIGVSLLLIIGCASPKLTNLDRGRSAYEVMEYNKTSTPLVVSASVLPVVPQAPQVAAPKLFFYDLKDSVPHTLINALEKKTESADTLIKLLKTNLAPSISETVCTNTVKTDFTKIKVRILFTNTKYYFRHKEFTHPNTRLAYLNTILKLKNSDFEISGIDKIENEEEAIDLGSLSRDQNVTFGLKGKAGTDISNENTNTSDETDSLNRNIGFESSKTLYDENGNPVKLMARNNGVNRSKTNSENNIFNKIFKGNLSAEADYNNQETIKEALALKRNRIKTGFSFNNKSITISQSGSPLTDINHNVVVTATLAAKSNVVKNQNVYSYYSLVTKDAKLLWPKDVEFNKFTYSFIKCNNSQTADSCSTPDTKITFTLDWEAQLRAVKQQRRGRHFLDFDDKVTNYYISKNSDNQKDAGTAFSINLNNYCKRNYKIQARIDNKEYVLVIQSAFLSEPEKMVFTSDKIEGMVFWLQTILKEANEANKEQLVNQKRTQLFFESIKNNSETGQKDLIPITFLSEDAINIKPFENIMEITAKEN